MGSCRAWSVYLTTRYWTGCSAKATHIFSAKNIRILYIESAKIVNEMTLNKVVKLTMLSTTGPRCVCVEVFTAQSTQWGHVERGQFT